MGSLVFRSDIGRKGTRGGQNGVTLNVNGCMLEILAFYPGEDKDKIGFRCFLRSDIGSKGTRGGQNGVPLNVKGCVLQS